MVPRRWRELGAESELRVALVVALGLLVEAAVATKILDVRLDVGSQLAAVWVWVVYSLVGRRDCAAELGAMTVSVLATAATLVLYAR